MNYKENDSVHDLDLYELLMSFLGFPFLFGNKWISIARETQIQLGHPNPKWRCAQKEAEPVTTHELKNFHRYKLPNSYPIRGDCITSVRGDFWTSSVDSLVFPSPTGYMLPSFGSLY